MNTRNTSENFIANIIDAINSQNLTLAADLIETAEYLFPLDGNIHFLAAMLKISRNDKTEAATQLWRALPLSPVSRLLRNCLFELFVEGTTEGEDLKKDFSLNSGERQVAVKIDQIRMDHRVRYEFVAQFLRRQYETPWRLTGLDAFCGNGYGSRIVSNMAGSRMMGIDGSQEAVELAERSYGSHRCVFGAAVFPFKIQPKSFDFAISFESIEHITTPEKLIVELSQSTDGPLFISVPNEESLPHCKFANQFEHHIRHFTRDELLDLLQSVGRRNILAEFGQNVYNTMDGQIRSLLTEDQMGLHFPTTSSQFFVLAVQ